MSSIGEPAIQAGARVREAAYAAPTQLSDAAARAGAAVSDAAGRTASEISRAAGDATAAAGDLGRQARSQISDLVDRHPLVLGGIGLAIGALIAASFRSTETESRLVGEASDRFKMRTREMLEEQFERAQSVAGRGYEAASKEAEEQGLSVDAAREAAAQLDEKAGAVAESAHEAAKQKADELKLGSPTA